MEKGTIRCTHMMRDWKQTILPMPTAAARHSPGVLSLQSALVVAGGDTLSYSYTTAVEIFKPDICHSGTGLTHYQELIEA